MFDTGITIVRVFIVLTAFILASFAMGAEDPYAEPAEPGLPASNMELDFPHVALVVTDPQIDFLSEKGVTWGIVGASVTHNKTVPNIGRLFKAAKKAGIPVIISPRKLPRQ